MCVCVRGVFGTFILGFTFAHYATGMGAKKQKPRMHHTALVHRTVCDGRLFFFSFFFCCASCPFDRLVRMHILLHLLAVSVFDGSGPDGVVFQPGPGPVLPRSVLFGVRSFFFFFLFLCWCGGAVVVTFQTSDHVPRLAVPYNRYGEYCCTTGCEKQETRVSGRSKRLTAYFNVL